MVSTFSVYVGLEILCLIVCLFVCFDIMQKRKKIHKKIYFWDNLKKKFCNIGIFRSKKNPFLKKHWFYFPLQL